ncbi:MAG: hypothetical protein KC493_16340 [Bacteriovoracaceae bacterium]|nr:hypothetical protein [Bacteriovoracaceae bacterium]
MQLTESLPGEFFEFHKFFSKVGVKLVPVKAKDFSEMMDGTKKHLLVVCKDMQSQKVFERYRSQFLDYALLNNKVCLFHVTSFSRIHIAHKVEQTYGYFYKRLPAHYKELSRFIAYTFFKQIRVDRKWPGGKRSKLPPLHKN